MQSIELLFDQARDALRNQDAARACELCEQARQINTQDTRFTLLHGFALRRLGEYDRAEPLLRAVLREDPSVDLVHHELGQALVGLGRLAEARQSLEKAVGLNPELVAAWRDLYEVRAAEGDDAGAAEAYRQSMRNKELDPLLKKAIESIGQGRLGVAEAICREYLKRRPHDVDAIRLLAEIGIAVGLAGESILLLERCLELAPDFMSLDLTTSRRYLAIRDLMMPFGRMNVFGRSSLITSLIRCSSLLPCRWQGALSRHTPRLPRPWRGHLLASAFSRATGIPFGTEVKVARQ